MHFFTDDNTGCNLNFLFLEIFTSNYLEMINFTVVLNLFKNFYTYFLALLEQLYLL